MRQTASRIPTLSMAVAAGLAVANLYFNQPMLALIEHAFPGSAAAAFIPTATQLGYALGMILLLPLGDLMERRGLIVAQFGLLALSLVVAAVAPSAGTLLAASCLVGLASSVTQQIIPYAATLAGDGKRGAVLGTVMSGVLGGILLGRTVAGFIAEHYGWRATFWAAVPAVLAAGALMAVKLPRSHRDAAMPYYKALHSLIDLWREEPVLRRATITQGALFGSFSVFWTVLSLRLEEPLFRLGADAAGLFGLLGLTGILAAPLSGRIADKRGPHAVVLLGAAAVLASWAVFGLWAAIPGLVVGVIVLDFGVQSAVVSNQHQIYALRPNARGRINTVYMTGMFLGGALGSAGAISFYHMAGWPAVCLFGGAVAGVGVLLQLDGARRRAEADA